MSESNFSTRALSGWGRYPVLAGNVTMPESMSSLYASIESSKNAELLARGLGRSYGDAAISNSNLVLTEKLNRYLSFDEKEGILHCQAGATFQEIIETFLPRGWFPAVTPGTKFVTMGGALASNIHGKNHHKDGSFINFVRSFKLIDASGKTIHCARDKNSDLFWATSGGMGLTGIISDLELSLRPVKSSQVVVKKLHCQNLAETIELIEQYETAYEYSVCWIDCLASGASLGRSILILGKHANSGELTTKAMRAKKRSIKVPADMPSWLLNRISIGTFNNLYYHFSLTTSQETLCHFEPFFYPLDSILDWNRMYGKNGFIQYQCVLPLEQSKAGLEEILALSSKRGRSSFLAVLKKFGPDHGLLSFPMSGYTLTLDMPVKPGLFDFTKELDEIVLKHQGRVYLAKDACLSPETFRKMYPEFPKWLKIKESVDPKTQFNSALSRRLAIGNQHA